MKPDLLSAVSRLGNDELLARVKDLANQSSEITASLVAHLCEIDRRRLYLGQACSSLFTYCTQVLHLSEPAAYRRIEAARAARRHPVILDLLAEGALHLTAVTLLSPHLTDDNHQEVLAAARLRSKREIQKLVAGLRPRPPAPSFIRKVPVPRAVPPVASPASEALASSAAPLASTTPAIEETPSPIAPSRPAVVTPLAPELYKVQFTASKELHEKLCRARDLLRHQIPSGDPAAIVDRALTGAGRRAREEEVCCHRAATQVVEAPFAKVRQGGNSVTSHPGRGQAWGLGARWRSVHLRGSRRATVHRDGPARVRPPGSPRGGRRVDAGEPPAPLPRSQPVRG